MNRNKVKKALQFYVAGHTIGDIAQFIDVNRIELRDKFTALGVTDNSTALLELRKMQESDESSNADGGRWDKGGKEVEEFTPPTTTYIGKYNKEAVAKKSPPKELIPLANQHEFRRDFKILDWNKCAAKWTDILRITEAKLKEQAKILLPIEYEKKFKKRKKD